MPTGPKGEKPPGVEISKGETPCPNKTALKCGPRPFSHHLFLPISPKYRKPQLEVTTSS